MASQAGKRAKNRPKLTINTNQERRENSINDYVDPKDRIQSMQISSSQKKKLISFLQSKGNLGTIDRQHIKNLGEIGHGSFGVVNKVQHTSGILMAQKSIRLEVKASVCNQIIRELEVLHNCNNPYIVGYYGAYQDEGQIYILMEFMDKGSLEDVYKVIKRFPEDKMSKIIYCVLEALLYLQKYHKVIHRDIRPSNILVNNSGEIKVCDFGVSGELINSMASTFVGTRSYMAPERLKGGNYTVRSDVWSLGIMIIELLLGRYPYPSLSDEEMNLWMSHDISDLSNIKMKQQNCSVFELLDLIVSNEPPVLPEKFFHPDTIDLINCCLKQEPAERYDLEQLLIHPYITKYKDIDLSDWIQEMKY